MKKLKMHSPDFSEENIARLASLFPNCVTEVEENNAGGTSNQEKKKYKKAIDWDLLKQELSSHIVEGPRERYHLDWPGKRKALLTANAPIAKTLRPCREESVDFDTTKNLFIEGDNLDALKLLQETYLGKVKMIYIDPPYNTGKDFIYNDRFAESTEEYLLDSGQKDEEGNRLVVNPESNGRFHSDWLSMMYSRLKLARNLLKDDGAILISCDEVEQPRLRLLMDEIYGQTNFIADIVWAAGRKNDSRLISVSHEYIVCYAKNFDYLFEKKIIWRQRKKGLTDIYKEYKRLKKNNGKDYITMTKELKKWYKNLANGHPAKAHKHYCQIDSSGVYFAADISWPGGGGPKYEVIHPVTKKAVKIPSRGWTTPDKNKMQEWIKDNKVHFGIDETTVPCLKKYLKESEYQTPYSLFYQDGRAASKRLRTLMDGDIFPFPKDEQVLQELIAMLSNSNDIILDFFAGSSTTAHAVMQLNAEDGGSRKFIMVQLPEACDEKKEAFKAGYKNIAEVSKERIRRAGKKIKEELTVKVSNNTSKGKSKSDQFSNDENTATDSGDSRELDTGFRVLKIDTSNMVDVYYTPDDQEQDLFASLADNIKQDRTAEDLLFQVLLDWGVDLTLPVARERIMDLEVFFVDEDALAACFVKNGEVTEDFCKELAKRKPLRVVFRDSGFRDDSTKINVEQIFKLMSPHTDVRSI